MKELSGLWIKASQDGNDQPVEAFKASIEVFGQVILCFDLKSFQCNFHFTLSHKSACEMKSLQLWRNNL